MSPRRRPGTARIQALLLASLVLGLALLVVPGPVRSTPPSGFATVKGSLNPPSANVFLDNLLVPAINGNYSQVMIPGNHTFHATFPGFQVFWHNFTSTTGQTVWINVSLKPTGIGNLNFNNTTNSTSGLTSSQLAVIAGVSFVGVLALASLFLMRRGRKRPPTTERRSGSGKSTAGGKSSGAGSKSSGTGGSGPKVSGSSAKSPSGKPPSKAGPKAPPKVPPST